MHTRALLTIFACLAAGCAVEADTATEQSDLLQPPPPRLYPVDFTVTAGTTGQNVVVGGEAVFPVTITAGAGQLCTDLSYSVTGLPYGATFWHQNAVGDPVSQICPSQRFDLDVGVDTAGNTLAGTYPLTITIAGSGYTHSVNVTLTVRPPSFTTTAWPPAANLVAGQSTNATLSTLYDGFSGDPFSQTTVYLSAYGLPPGVSVAFSPPTITPTTSSTVTFTAAADATVTPATVTLVAVGSGGMRRTTTFALGPNSQLIANGGFEAGTSPWSLGGGAALATYSPSPVAYWPSTNEAHLGSSYISEQGTGTVAQTVAIPANASHATLAFWLAGTGSEPARASVSVTDATSGATLSLGSFNDLVTVQEPLSVGERPPEYQRHDLDITALRGRTVTVMFQLASNATTPSSRAVLDDVSVAVTY